MTSLGIGGPAEILVVPQTIDMALRTIELLEGESIEVRFMGAGTNLLVDDSGIEGAVLKTENLSSYEVRGDLILSESGISLKRLCHIALENSLTGLEELYGIPGSLGGAIFMNAGAYGKEMADVLEWVELFDGKELKRFSPEDLGMRYRSGETGGRFITRAAIRLKRGDPEKIEKRMRDFIERRLEKQPVFERSAGSLFKRPRPDFYVGKAIEELGFKGFRVGGVKISEKHAGFMVNVGTGTFEDAMKLIEKIRLTVKRVYGVELETEVVVCR